MWLQVTLSIHALHIFRDHQALKRRLSTGQRLHPPFFGSDNLSQVWVKSHLSESNLSKKGPPKCAYSRHILFCDKSAKLFHKSMEKKNSDNPFLTLSCSYLFHSMKGLISWSLFQGHLYFKTKKYSLFLFKLALLANDSDCLPKVCYLKLKKLRYLSKLR